MSLYGPPPNVSVGEALHLIFSHYCSPYKSSISQYNNIENIEENNNALTMDGVSFSRMCREAPDLNKYISRTDIDVVFSKTKPIGIRRLEYDHFLDVLLELAIRIYPDEDPIIALANFISKFIFALFDQPPSKDGEAEIEKILNELTME